MLIFTLSYLAYAAALWRFRGGGIIATGSTQLARGLTAIGLMVPLAIWFANPWLMVAALGIFAGMAAVGWGDFADMGRTEPKSEELVSPLVLKLFPASSVEHDVAGMALTGTILTMFCIAGLGLADWLSPSLALVGPGLMSAWAGAAFGPLYWLGWKLTPLTGTETAEWLCGAAVGATLLIALTSP